MTRILLTAIALLLLLGPAGCQDLGVGHEGEACNKQNQCRPGLVCVLDKCLRPGDDGGQDGEDGQVDDGDGGQVDDGDGGQVDDGDGGLADDGGEPDPPALEDTWAHAWEGLTGGMYQVPSMHLALTSDDHLFIAGIYDHGFDFGFPGEEPDPNNGTDFYIGKFTADGELDWGRSFGSQNEQELAALAVDSDGNAYIGGTFEGVLNFSKYEEGFQDCTAEVADGFDAYVASFAPNGDLRWVRCWGGDGPQAVTALVVSPVQTRVFAAGTFEVQLGDEELDYTSGTDGFVLALMTETGLTNSKMNLGGANHQVPTALAMHLQNEAVYVAGHYVGDITEVGGVTDPCFDFPGGYGYQSGFLMKLDPNLVGDCTWGIALGDAGGSEATSIGDLLRAGTDDLWLTGGYEGQLGFFAEGLDSPTTLGISQAEDAWLAHLDGDGNLVWWSEYGQASSQRGLALASAYIPGDPQPAPVYVAGLFDQEINFGGNPMTTPANNGDAFLAIFDTEHQHTWSRAYGDTQSQEGRALAVDRNGTVYLAGTSTGEVTLADDTYLPTGSKLIFLVRLDPPE